jgi:hypothetical protein
LFQQLNNQNMTENSSTPEIKKEFKPFKKLSPFVADPHNSRGGKGGAKGSHNSSSGNKGGKSINVVTRKSGSGGDR